MELGAVVEGDGPEIAPMLTDRGKGRWVTEVAVREVILRMITRPDFLSTRVSMQWCRSLPITVSPSQWSSCVRVWIWEGRIEI